MILLILGLALWVGVYFWKWLVFASCVGMGDKGKMIVVLGVVLGIVLMVIGYKMADGVVYWGWTVVMMGINNLLMLFVFYLYVASGVKTWIMRMIWYL